MNDPARIRQMDLERLLFLVSFVRMVPRFLRLETQLSQKQTIARCATEVSRLAQAFFDI